MLCDLKFFIPDVVAYFNNKIRQYKELEKSGKFVSTDWLAKANNLQNLVDELVWLYGNPPSDNIRFDYLYWEAGAGVAYANMTIDEITEIFKDGFWSCLLEDKQQRALGEYHLSDLSQDILNHFRKAGRLEEIQSAD